MTALPATLLTLVVMVKNEERTIARTLASAKPYIDRWLVLDTGSTDRTKEVVAETMAGKPGRIAEADFVDFATSRNRSLEECGDHSEFILWMDADDVLDGGDALRGFLEKERNKTGTEREAYYVRVLAGVTFDSARVLRSRHKWRFRGVVHEVLMHPDRTPPSLRVPGVLIRHEVEAEAAERSRQRWERDVGLLSGALQVDPSDTRAAFYLGLTYFWLGRWDEAIVALERRMKMGGWHEEVFQAELHAARAADSAEHLWSDVLARYLSAFSAAPHRAEPLYYVALHYNADGQPHLCYLFARRGQELPFPSQDTLFVDEDVYAWGMADLVGSSAFYVGAFDVGEAAMRHALRHRPDDARLQGNLEFYLDRKRKLKAERRRR